jgi:hypothetical protein
MLIFADPSLVFFAVPKTGTSAIEKRLKGRADVAITQPRSKHMTPRRYRATLEAAINDTFKIAPDYMAILRDPVDRLGSWYRYRMRQNLKGKKASTEGVSFADFVAAHLEEPQPRFAGKIVPQTDFVYDSDGTPILTHLFAYERPDLWTAFLSARFGRELTFERVNVSQPLPLDLPGDLRRRLEEHMAPEVELHRRLAQAGFLGTGGTPI